MPGKKKFVLTDHTARVVARFIKCEVGEVVTWDELTGIIGYDARLEGKPNVQYARKIVLRDYGFVFGAVHGVGLKRLNDSEVVDRGSLRRRKIHNQTRYGLSELGTLDNRINQLPQEEQIRLLAGKTMLSVLQVGSSKLQEGQARKNSAQIIPGVSMKDFKGA